MPASDVLDSRRAKNKVLYTVQKRKMGGKGIYVEEKRRKTRIFTIEQHEKRKIKFTVYKFSPVRNRT